MMTKKLKVVLLAVLAAICAACLFVGCKIGPDTKEEYLEGMDINVTYYSGDGTFDTSSTLNVRETYFGSIEALGGVPFFNVSTEDQTSSNGIYIKLAGYDFVGWYKAAVYDSGEHAGEIIYTYQEEGSSDAVYVFPVEEEDGTPVVDAKTARPVFAREGVDEQIPESDVRLEPSGEMLTSDYIVKSGEHLTVVAVWTKSLRIHYVLVCEEGKTYYDSEGNAYTNGSVLSESVFGSGETASVNSSRRPLDLSGATFVRTYAEEECENLISSVQRPEEGITSVDVYSFYLDGTWTIVSNASEAESMFKALSGDYYILNDVDCSSSSTTVNLHTELQTFSGKICGNGHTITGLKFGVTQVTRGRHYSIFGTIAETASIEDLTLKDITITARVSATEVCLYAIFSACDDGARFSDFKVDGLQCEITITSAGALDNIPSRDGSYDTKNWIFGGAASDEAYLQSNNGLTMENYDITVK